ncbi:MAG: methyltransferase domain-containing protein [Anaerolineae bacterium]|nr:methyltransferase domain-containing protein [Anaerolineae bacterium]
MNRVQRFAENILRLGKRPRLGELPPIKKPGESAPTSVDSYWGDFTVYALPFKSAQESLDYLEWRFDQYPLFREFMQLYGQHDHQVVLDYGCGPGNDLVGFLVHTQAKKVIGVDISAKALGIAAKRLALHDINPERMELIQITDSNPEIPLDSASVDYIYCEGVLHHTSHPDAILQEFQRILKPDGQACLMVYNRNSLWLHLHTAYIKMVLENAFPGLSLEDAFAKTTDSEDCPIARCHTPEEFIAICNRAGFQAEYVGGYLSLHELLILKELGQQAMADERLGVEHREFLRALTYDESGYPMYEGKHAGIGGVYRLYKTG